MWRPRERKRQSERHMWRGVERGSARRNGIGCGSETVKEKNNWGQTWSAVSE